MTGRSRRSTYDAIFYGGEEFVLARSNPARVFDPGVYGIRPSWRRGTDAYRAVRCEFSVRDSVLHINLLAVDSDDRPFPTIGGVSPAMRHDDARRSCPDATYAFEQCQVCYSGMLRIARDGITNCRYPIGREHDVSGFCDPIQFAQVLDLTFVDGVMVAVRDISRELWKIRALYRRIEGLLARGLLTQKDLRMLEDTPGCQSAEDLSIGFQDADADALEARIETILGDRRP